MLGPYLPYGPLLLHRSSDFLLLWHSHIPGQLPLGNLRNSRKVPTFCTSGLEQERQLYQPASKPYDCAGYVS